MVREAVVGENTVKENVAKTRVEGVIKVDEELFVATFHLARRSTHEDITYSSDGERLQKKKLNYASFIDNCNQTSVHI